ncbi:hypothetical protein [Bacteroides sp. UW]|uniref:hypothetical protein n=3 Tax=Bacteroides TaxID=816 RepID=UPI001EF9DE98|nr:hypothetical protein [Bacteroides sp. UW]
MKRNVFSLIVVLMATVSFVNVWISVTSTNKKMKIRLAAIEAMAMIEAETPGDTELSLAGACKITSNCYNWAGNVDGSITCWGAIVSEESGRKGLFLSKRFVGWSVTVKKQNVDYG